MPTKPTSLVDGGITKGEVSHLVRDLAPLASGELRTLRDDIFVAGHQYAFLSCLQELQKLKRRNQLTPMDLQRLVTSMAIATDKSLLLAGRPTQLVAGIHKVRHELPDILAKLLRVKAIPPQGMLSSAQYDSSVDVSGT